MERVDRSKDGPPPLKETRRSLCVPSRHGWVGRCAAHSQTESTSVLQNAEPARVCQIILGLNMSTVRLQVDSKQRLITRVYCPFSVTRTWKDPELFSIYLQDSRVRVCVARKTNDQALSQICILNFASKRSVQKVFSVVFSRFSVDIKRNPH